MKLRNRLVVIIGLSTLVPLMITGATTTQLARDHHISQAQELYARQAGGLAAFAATWVDDRVEGLALAAQVFPVAALGPEELLGLQRLVYAQVSSVSVVAVVDREGRTVLPPLSLSDPASAGFEGKEGVDEAGALALSASLPVTEALATGRAVGAIREGEAAWVPVAVAAGPERVLGARLSLAPLEEHLGRQALPSGAAVLVDPDAGVIIGPGVELVDLQALRAFSGQLSGDLRYRIAEQPVLASFETVPGTSWVAVVAVPEAVANMGARRIEKRTFFMYGLAVALVAAMGGVAARQISRPVIALQDAAQRLGRGELGTKVEVEGADEVSDLASAFNQMSESIRLSNEEIAAKNQEIEAFNRDLQQRVEERTRELRDSQAHLVQASRLAAVAQMGAGLAHELNNPVAGILGMAQIARLKAQDGPLSPLIAAIEDQAQRCRAVLTSLTRLSGNRGGGERIPIDMAALLRDVEALARVGFAEAGVALVVEAGELPRVEGDPALLGQSLAQLLASVRARGATGARVRMRAGASKRELRIELDVEGPERPDSDDWLASGMGFFLASQVLRDHGGALEEPAGGERRWVVSLPVLPGSSPVVS